jgi:GNAT superfamily N-acetyltransferase
MVNAMEWTRGEYVITTDQSRFDFEAVHAFLTNVYWSRGIPMDTVRKAARNSMAFALLHGDRQIGYARVITDRATFAYLADVFVIDAYRGQKLAVWLMEVIAAHPELQNLRRWLLSTRDAHTLYAKIGFRPVAEPARFMERNDPDIYRRAAAPEGRSE